MQPSFLGWDIGGAHVKVALANASESIAKVYQLSCPLWLGLDRLRESISVAQQKFDFSHLAHAVTMTGEMADHFSSRKNGVTRLVKTMEDNLRNGQISYFAGNRGFVSSAKAVRVHEEIASANWLASTNFVATKVSDALFIDIGSTTTDIARIRDHKATVDGYSDVDRLYAQELVYCGVTRTPIFALCKSAPIKDKFIPVINECFASTADVYRITEELPQCVDTGETPDGRSKDIVHSAIRLARMFGCDADRQKLEIWRHVAKYVREQQMQMIIDACYQQLSKSKQLQKAPIVGAGAGRFLIKEIAQRLNLQYIDFESLLDYRKTNNEITPGDCAPAAAVACLAYQRFFHE